MYACIGSPGSSQDGLFTCHGEKSFFDFLLNRMLIFLSLPAMIGSSVVFDYYFKIFQHILVTLNILLFVEGYYRYKHEINTKFVNIEITKFTDI